MHVVFTQHFLPYFVPRPVTGPTRPEPCTPHLATFFSLASSLYRVYHLPNVKKLWMLPLLGLFFLCSYASAQVAFPAARVNVRVQIYAPNGARMEGNIRFRLSGEDGDRPPETFDTDTKGSCVLYSMTQGMSYTLVVDSDGKNWATTTERFYVLGTRSNVTIHLRPLESVASSAAIVSVAELNQNIPRAARNEYGAAVEQLAAGDLDRARKSFQRAIDLYPDFVEARSELAVLRMREGDIAGAEALLRRALEIDNAAVRATLNLGLCLYRQQRYADALPFLERGVQLQPVNGHAHLLLGITLVMSGDDARAEPILLRAYEQGGKPCARAQYYLSRLYTRQKNYPRAAGALEVYLRDLPDEPDAESLRATLTKLRAAARP
jgi:tetratricopeptide (TPR) repeat protein